jgi:hypothetical protein
MKRKEKHQKLEKDSKKLKHLWNAMQKDGSKTKESIINEIETYRYLPKGLAISITGNSLMPS